jgi:hypothetical protein
LETVVLVYHPAHDPYHCALRTLAILRASEQPALDVDKVRIIDFYVLFPSLVSEITLPRPLSSLRTAAAKQQHAYEYVDNPKQVFLELKEIQYSTYLALAGQNVIDPAQLESRLLAIRDQNIPEDIHSTIKKFLGENKGISETISRGLSLIPLLGAGGLKARTGLMEYRYDIVEANATR